jgi:uncharacterized protein
MGPMSERFEMRLDGEILAKVDDWRAEQNDVPSRAEAMRRLVELGLGKSTSEAVQFTDGEKLLLCMMDDVYRHFKIQGATDPHFISQVIHGGHYWAPKWELTGLFHDYEDDPSDVRFVSNVLDMWRFIESGFAKLSKKDKEHLAKEADPFGRHVKFMGFDGNYEAPLMSIARFLVDEMDRWSEFKGRELNSHAPMREFYRRMLSVFEPMRSGLVGMELNASQLIQILKR